MQAFDEFAKPDVYLNTCICIYGTKMSDLYVAISFHRLSVTTRTRCRLAVISYLDVSSTQVQLKIMA